MSLSLLGMSQIRNRGTEMNFTVGYRRYSGRRQYRIVGHPLVDPIWHDIYDYIAILQARRAVIDMFTGTYTPNGNAKLGKLGVFNR